MQAGTHKGRKVSYGRITAYKHTAGDDATRRQVTAVSLGTQPSAWPHDVHTQNTRSRKDRLRMSWLG